MVVYERSQIAGERFDTASVDLQTPITHILHKEISAVIVEMIREILCIGYFCDNWNHLL